MTMAQGIILFPSIHFALKAEKVIKEKGFVSKLIPIPRHLSSDCGVGLRIPWEEKDMIRKVLEEAAVRMEALHPLTSG